MLHFATEEGDWLSYKEIRRGARLRIVMGIELYTFNNRPYTFRFVAQNVFVIENGPDSTPVDDDALVIQPATQPDPIFVPRKRAAPTSIGDAGSSSGSSGSGSGGGSSSSKSGGEDDGGKGLKHARL